MNNTWKEIVAQESLETATQNEREIKQKYSGISVGEKYFFIDMLEILEYKMKGSYVHAYTLHLYQKEYESIKTRYETRYFKKVAEFNESYVFGSEETFCTFKNVELTDREINNTSLFTEQLISDMRRIQLWREKLHNYNVKRIKGI